MDRSATLLVWWVSGLVLYAFDVYWFYHWWGAIGALIGLLVPPLAFVFPFIYRAMEGFSFFYLGAWAVGILALCIGSSSKTSHTPDFDDADSDAID